MLLLLKMESVLPSTQKESKPKYRLGRIMNKYLILDIYMSAYPTREETVFRMFKHDRASRHLLL
jgi:hypothetical protein